MGNVQLFVNVTAVSVIQLLVERDLAFARAVAFSLKEHNRLLQAIEDGEDISDLI
jgi:hypothetical protein